MIGKLEETIQNKYHEILYPDLLKNIVDNLRFEYPALIEDIVPEKISYGLLTETAKIVLSKGNSICYLPKMIEVMECALRRKRAGSGRTDYPGNLPERQFLPHPGAATGTEYLMAACVDSILYGTPKFTVTPHATSCSTPHESRGLRLGIF
jgi:hypothetical protein